jgi:hypothetical protein
MAVTATFGLVAAAYTLKKLAAAKPAVSDPQQWPDDTGSL